MVLIKIDLVKQLENKYVTPYINHKQFLWKSIILTLAGRLKRIYLQR